jgi:pyruvate dehydrogenase E2 component (dihydrolipoamide acetyltransferase)
MASVVRMPEVLTGMTEAVLVGWRVSPGEEVSVGQPIAEIETEKAVVDYEAEQAGTVAGFLADVGSPIAVGAPILVLAAAGESAEQAMTQASATADGPTPPEPSGSSNPSPVTDGGSAGEAAPATRDEPDRASVTDPPLNRAATTTEDPPQRRFISPLVRRLARERGVDLTPIAGTGPGGRIVRRDLDRYQANGASKVAELTATRRVPAPVAAPAGQPPAASPSPTPRHDDSGYTDVPHTGMRRAIARRLTESKTTVPHFYLVADCRVDALLELRRTIKADIAAGVPTPSINDFVIKAVGGAFQDVPEANAIWTPDATRRFDSVSVAVAVAVDRGLVTPVVRDVDRRSIGDISRTTADLAARARDGRLNQVELEGGSFAVSNLGMYGIERFAAIINPPQAGILAVGAATKRPVVDDNGAVGVATMMTVTLSGDHRVLDGALAAQWLRAFQDRIEHPMRLLL